MIVTLVSFPRPDWATRTLVGDDGVMSTTSTPPRSRYAMGTLPNMLRSLVVIGALVALVIFLVPRVNSLSGPPVDIEASASQVAKDSGWPVARAVGLPKGWSATSARYVPAVGNQMTWLAGYQAPSGNYVSVEQTQDPTARWIQTEINRGASQGTVVIAGRTWTKYERSSKTQNSLVHKPESTGELTTMVTGTGSFDELAVLAEHLQPVTATH